MHYAEVVTVQESQIETTFAIQIVALWIADGGNGQNGKLAL